MYSSLLYVCSIPFPILPSFSFFPFFKNFHVGVIVDSHAVVRNHKEGSLVPFTKYLPMETSRKAMVQHHNQDTDIGSPLTLFRFPRFYLHLFVCVLNSTQFITLWICMCTATIKVTVQVQHKFVLPFYDHTLPVSTPLNPYPNLWQLNSPPFVKCVISQMLYK